MRADVAARDSFADLLSDTLPDYGTTKTLVPRSAAMVCSTINESDRVESPLEQLFVNQLATANRLAMRFMAAADNELTGYENTNHHGRSVEAARCSNAAVRLMAAGTDLADAISRLRRTERPNHSAAFEVNVSLGGQR